MSLHDRIMNLRHELGDDEAWTKDECGAYNTGIEDAADVAKEADALMVEMAQTLEELRDYDRNNKSEALSAYKSILETLGNYYHFKESAK